MTLIPETYMARAMVFIQAHPGRDMGSIVALALMEGGQGVRLPRVGLTHQQLATAEFIASYEEQYGVGPTFDEIREHLGLASKSGVHRIVEGLVERGAVVRLPNRWRSVSAIRRAA